jgi:hypothetical protein
LEGALNLFLLGGYVPPNGSSFELISAAAGLLGNFATTSGRTIGGGRYFQPSYGESIFAVGTSVDASLPAVTVSTPLANATYPGTGGGLLTSTTGTASDAGSGLVKVTVSLARYSGSAVDAPINAYYSFATNTFTTPYAVSSHEGQATGTSNWSLAFPSLAVGFYGIRATAYDLGGNTTASAFVRFAVPVSYTISGKVTDSAGVGIAGVSVTRSGIGTSVQATTSATGTYSFPFSINGAHTVTASQQGYVFAPPSTVVTVSNANVGNVLFLRLQVPAISGRITNALNTGIGSVTVTRTGGVSAVTNAAGYYGFSAVPISQSAYTLTPSRSGLSFTPAPRLVTVAANSHYANQNYTASFQITGKVINSSALPVSGVKVQRIHASGTIEATTNAQGVYSFSAVPASNTAYTIKPVLAGGVFSPSSTAVSVTTNRHTGIDFTLTGMADSAAAENASSSPSITQLSTATATLSEGKLVVELTFTGSLNARSASESTNFSVQIGGEPVVITSAHWDAAYNRVTLTLPATGIKAGDNVALSWRNLLDAQGKALAPETYSIAAQ